MSLGLSGKGRRSTPMTGRSRCSTRARRLPRRPQIPVMTMGASVLTRSPENALSRFHAAIQNRVDGLLHEKYFFFHHRIVVVGIAGELHRLAEINPIARGQGELTSRQKKPRHDRKRG